MGSATSKTTNGGAATSYCEDRQAGEPTVVKINNSGIDTTVEGYVNVLSKHNDCIKEINSGCDETLLNPKGPADDKNDVNNKQIINSGNTQFKYKIHWDKHARRHSRLNPREKCLVGLENYRRTASPQLLMASRENYGRIKDAADLLWLQPSDTDGTATETTKTDVGGPLDVVDLTPNNVTNRNIFREVSDSTSKDSVPTEKTQQRVDRNVHEMFRPTRTSPRDISYPTKIPSPSRLKSSSPPRNYDSGGKTGSPKLRSRDNSLDRCQPTTSGQSPPFLAPLRYGKLGLQGGAIRKELEKEGILGAGQAENNPDVMLRELRHMWHVRQTTSGTSYCLQEDEQGRSNIASRLPPIEPDATVQKILEKQQRFSDRIEKIQGEREERVRKFKEKHRSAKMRREQIQQDQSSLVDEEAERLKLKMLDLELM